MANGTSRGPTTKQATSNLTSPQWSASSTSFHSIATTRYQRTPTTDYSALTKQLQRTRGTPRRRIPLFVLPATVFVIGLVATITIGSVGVAHLRHTNDRFAQERADVMAKTLAVRISATESTSHCALIHRAERRTTAEVLLIDRSGAIVIDGSVGCSDTDVSDGSTDNHADSMASNSSSHGAIRDAGGDTLVFSGSQADSLLGFLSRERGEVITRRGRAMLGVGLAHAPFDNLAVMVFVRAPIPSEGEASLIGSLLVLTAWLLGVGVIVAFVFSHEIHSDVDFVSGEIAKMAKARPGSVGSPIQIRAIDQIGVLSNDINRLMERFGTALSAYEKDMDRAVSLDRDRVAFIRTLSHEFRTPLNAILGFSDVLLGGVDGTIDSDTRENIELIRSSGSQLRGLIDDILELSALESGQLRLSKSIVDVRQVVEDVAREASVRLAGKQVVLTVDGPSSAPAFVDQRRLWQIVSNLVSNAIKFTSQGEIRLSFASDDSGLSFTVSDTGSGIASADIESIFTEFRQVGPAASRTRGTGLGLFIARTLVSMHGGTIRAESELGRGSTFFVHLPALVE